LCARGGGEKAGSGACVEQRIVTPKCLKACRDPAENRGMERSKIGIGRGSPTHTPTSCPLEHVVVADRTHSIVTSTIAT